jgi:hypothetical protein
MWLPMRAAGSHMLSSITRARCERVSRVSRNVVLLHSPVQTAYRDQIAVCVTPPSRAIVEGDGLVCRIYRDAQRSVEDKQDMEADSKNTRHR